MFEYNFKIPPPATGLINATDSPLEWILDIPKTTALTTGKLAMLLFTSKSLGKQSPKLLHQFNSVESLILGAGKLSRIKGAQQGFVRGNPDAIFKSISKEGREISPNRVLLPDGTIITKYISSTTGVSTLQINKDGRLFKIRIDE